MRNIYTMCVTSGILLFIGGFIAGALMAALMFFIVMLLGH